MFKAVKATIGALAVAATMAGGSLVAVPTAQAEPGFYGAQVHHVGGKKNYKGRNWNRGWNNRPYYNYNNNRYRYNRGWNNNWVGPAIGLGAGVIIGSMLAAPRYAPPPPPRGYYGDRQAYCAQKYRSYNPRTGTYTGYDGRQHYCRIP